MILPAFETRRCMIDQCYWLSHAWIRTFASQMPYSIYATVICRCRHGNAWVLLSWKVSIVSTLHGPCLESLMHPCMYSWQPCSKYPMQALMRVHFRRLHVYMYIRHLNRKTWNCWLCKQQTQSNYRERQLLAPPRYAPTPDTWTEWS